MIADLSGDRALKDHSQDRLGFAATAKEFAKVLLDQEFAGGMVFGIEGEWGSGKSSLVNLMVEELLLTEETRRPIVIEFKPWLVGDRDSLLLSLFSDLAAAVDKMELGAGDATAATASAIGKAGEQVRRFASHLGGLSKVVKIAGAVVPMASLLADGIEAVSEAAKSLERTPVLAEEKEKLNERLAQLKHKIIITIDDVDRLEPREIMELLRLVRSVADFSNVTYVLCYDPDIVAHGLQVAAKIGDGRAYIEKIIQIAISVPRPEPFDLRRWFSEEISKLHTTPPDQPGTTIASIVDLEGGRYLRTPRHVVRCLDSIRFIWRAIEHRVDFADLVWLQLTKIGNPDLFVWTGDYLALSAVLSSGRARVGEGEKRKFKKRLKLASKREGATVKELLRRLADFLPGLESPLSKTEEFLFGNWHQEKISTAIRQRRLASPDHYRLYFAAEEPRNSPRSGDFEDLFAALDHSSGRLEAMLNKWSVDKLTTGASKAEVILNRLRTMNIDLFKPPRVQTLLATLSDVLDELGGSAPVGVDDPQTWLEGRQLLGWLLPTLKRRKDQETALKRMFGEGRALSWLTSILRSETFAHGRAGDRPSSDRLLSSEQFDLIGAVMVKRYQAMSFSSIMGLPRPLSALYAWAQGGDQNGPRRLILPLTHSNEGLVEVLEHLQGKVYTTDGEYMTLSRDNLELFVDFDACKERIEELAISDMDREIRDRAKKLKLSFDSGRNF